MQRTKTIYADTGNGRFRITIEANTSCLTKQESDDAVDMLADSAMRALNETRYIRAPLCKIKVKGR